MKKNILTLSTFLIVMWWFILETVYGDTLEKQINNALVLSMIIYLFVLYIIFFRSKEYKRQFPLFTIMFVHILLTIVVIFIKGLFIPTFIYERPQLTNDEIKNQLEEAYDYALSVGDKEEAKSYKLYLANNQKKYPDEDFKVDFYQGIPERTEKRLLSTIDQAEDFYSTEITVDSLQSLDKDKLVFMIKNYIATDEYPSAKMFSLFYTNLYGEDKNSKEIQRLLQPYEEKTTLHKLSSKDTVYYDYVDDLYEIIKDVGEKEEDLISAYYILLALKNTTKSTSIQEVEWLEEKILGLLSERLFFSGDARIAATHFREAQNIMFIEPRSDEFLFYHALDGVFDKVNNIMYLKDLHVISISRAKKEIQWLISVPYAKVINNTLYSKSIERNIINVRTQFTLRYKAPSVINTNQILAPVREIGLSAKEISKLRPTYIYVNSRNILQVASIFALWEKFKLPTSLLTEKFYGICVEGFLFLIFGLLFIRYFLKIIAKQLTPKEINKLIAIALLAFVPVYLQAYSFGLFLLRVFPSTVQVMFIIINISVFLAVTIYLIRDMLMIYHALYDKKVKDDSIFRHR